MGLSNSLSLFTSLKLKLPYSSFVFPKISLYTLFLLNFGFIYVKPIVVNEPENWLIELLLIVLSKFLLTILISFFTSFNRLILSDIGYRLLYFLVFSGLSPSF